MLFSNRDDEGLIVTPSPSYSSDKDMVEHLLLQRCSIIAVGQRCADWFVLRQFRLTGTSAGTIFIADSTVRECVGLPQRQGFGEITLSERLKSLSQTWFSASWSNEAIKRGSMNERAIFAALSFKPFVQAVYECGMLSRADADWMACSPDGIALIDTGQLGISEDVAAHSSIELASVEIKTNVGISSLDRASGMATVDVKTCRVGDATWNKYVPTEHMGQVLHQLPVLSVHYLIYVSAAEVGIMYILVVQCSDDILHICIEALRRCAESSIAWAHDEEP